MVSYSHVSTLPNSPTPMLALLLLGYELKTA